ncbi:hypothetical protein PRIPAC_81707, partial [Pristionchus pacificus]|uniref:Uncharacterized protein n=1 Tax=Pristionchus pacificus TaxID=54126 RepID=A0A2A6C3I6_PRIPA
MTMDGVYDGFTYFMMGIGKRIQGVPILLLSVRCVFVLTKYEYWTNSFCRIFVIALIVVTNYMPIADACSFQNAITFWNLLFWLRASWMGLFPDFFTLIRKVWWMPYADFIVRYVHFHVPTNYPFISCLLTFSMLLSLAMSANRFTALYFSVRINDEVEFIPIIDASGKTRFAFQNIDLNGNIDLYWMCFQALLDAALNIATLSRFIRLRNMNSAKRSAFDISPLECGIALRQKISLEFWIQVLDASTLLPPVFIILLTKEIRNTFI